MKLRAPPRGGTATARTIEAVPTSIAELGIGDVVFRNHPALILKKEDLELRFLGIRFMKIDGIVGWPAIRRMKVVLDFPKKIMTISPPASPPPQYKRLFEIGFPVVRLISLDGIDLFFGLDTGGRQTGIRSGLLRKIPLLDAQTATTTRWSAGGSQTAKTTRVKELSLLLDGWLLRFRDVETSPSQPAAFIELDGMIGCDVMMNMRVTIDASNGIFELDVGAD